MNTEVEGTGPAPEQKCLPVRASIHAAPGVREHREHQAPVRAAAARHRTGLANRAGGGHRFAISVVQVPRQSIERASSSLVTEVSLGRAGIVMGLEVSRLARNSTDWHRLLEICALADTLILDEDGVYDPAHFNDRLLLGLKGTMSEAELHVLKARLRGGILNKARRGELEMRLPIGFVHGPQGRVRLDPDVRIQDSVRQLLRTFQRTGSATATVKAFREQGLRFPRRALTGPHTGEVLWSELAHSRALFVLHNPFYAGAFTLVEHASANCPMAAASSDICRRPNGQRSFAMLTKAT